MGWIIPDYHYLTVITAARGKKDDDRERTPRCLWTIEPRGSITHLGRLLRHPRRSNVAFSETRPANAPRSHGGD